MTRTSLNTLDTIRKIREAQYEQVKDMSPQERLAFYRNKAKALESQIAMLVETAQQSTNAR